MLKKKKKKKNKNKKKKKNIYTITESVDEMKMLVKKKKWYW